MRQLLEIESIPIKLEVKMTRAKWERSNPLNDSSVYNNNLNAVHEARSKSNSSAVDSAAKISQASNNRNKSVGLDIYDNKPKPVSYAEALSYKSAAGVLMNKAVNDPENGYLQAGIQNNSMAVAAKDLSLHPVSPAQYANIESVQIRDISIDSYERDRAGFDARQAMIRSNYEFIPGSIEFTVAQRNEVRFTYTGTPIYVPKSADPEYVEA